MTDYKRSDRTSYTPGTGIPIALPFGSNAPPSSMQVNDPFGRSRGTHTPHSGSSQPAHSSPGRVGSIALARIDELMPDRDRLVLQRIAEHRYLSTHQIQHFVFTDHETDASASRTARRVLQRLERMHLVRPLARRVGGVRGGSTAQIWQLAPAAARLLREDGTTFRTHEPSLRFLAHCLAVADVHLVIRQLQLDPGVVSTDVQVEPRSWRRYAGLGGEARWLQPDLASVVSTDQYDDRWFIEVDLGSESLPTLLRKCGQYESYRASGIEQEAHEAFPLVLWVFTKPERAERLRHSVARSPRLTPQLYRFATPANLVSVLMEAAS